MTPDPLETADTATATGPSITDRRARLAVSLLFLTNGALFANLLPRYPAIKDGLGLSNGQFGAAVAAFPLGALIAGLAAATLIRRFRSSRVAVAGTILTGTGILLAGLAPSWALLAGALFIAGAADAITDVAQNSHGLRVQRRYGRSILNSFHAAWSVGAVLGGLMGAAASGADIPRGIHLGLSLILFSALALYCRRTLLPGPEPTGLDTADQHDDGIPRARISRLATYGILAALVLVATGGSIIEDAGNSWSAIYLHDSLGAVAPVTALGFVALIGCQLVGRLIGDQLFDTFGQRLVARAGGAIVVVGMGLALAFPTIPGTIIGFGLSGFGMATLIPAAMHAADELPGLRHGTGLTILGWLMRVGFLFSPPIVGFVADRTNLATGLLIVPLAGLLVIVCAGVLPRKTRT
ncbi:MFS transporter [Arthrobacter rhombi]|uniref:Membrane protein mosC n=1 Tax=Arthrobacter rhombi TaxID=71253 RepID=A0A1R4FWT0_9MICC|nr:Membrane protein mosC [Arthrobacter rhombi]